MKLRLHYNTRDCAACAAYNEAITNLLRAETLQRVKTRFGWARKSELPVGGRRAPW